MAVDVRSRLGISDEQLAEFCRKWKIQKLELFGSALREDFDPENSDLDLLYVTEPGAWSLLDHVGAEEELEGILGRKVDLVSRNAVERSRNRMRRNAILESTHPIYAA
jgi:predicted nucleotidyltransferase